MNMGDHADAVPDAVPSLLLSSRNPATALTLIADLLAGGGSRPGRSLEAVQEGPRPPAGSRGTEFGPC